MSAVVEKAARVLNDIAGKKIAVGVSGGRDSVCLLHAVLHCGLFRADDVAAVHVNHRLRDEADADEAFVKAYCGKLGVSFRAFTVDVKKASAEKSLSVEQAARELRYDALYSLVKSGDAEYILTAHHALDNAESVLMHLFRGSGLDGLCGIKKQSGVIVRPFIDVLPAELDEYVKENKLEYVTDKTNFEDDADRNFIRLKVLPLVERRYKGAVRAVNAAASECADAREALESALDISDIGYSRGAVTVSDGALFSPLAARYVRRAASYFSLVDLTREMTESAVALKGKRTGATADMNNGVKAVREYDGIALYVPRMKFEGEYPVKLGANFIDGLRVDIRLSDIDVGKVCGGAVDLDKLDGTVLRFRRDGDMFTPCGGKRKKLKQYFNDKKIAKRMRDRLPLICRGGEVLVIVGVEVSDSVKQTENTKNRAAVFGRGPYD